MADGPTRRFALVSREVYPFGGAGIGEYIAACAELLSSVGEVTLFTTSLHEETYHALSAAGDPRMPPPGVRVVFVPEPGEDLAGYFCSLHVYSARVLESLRRHYGRQGPDLVEFSDYLGEGALTAQARRAGDPMLRTTKVGVRLHTSAEVCAVLDGYLDPTFEGQVIYELERMALRDCDAVLWPGGDTLELYRRFYGPRLAPGRRIRNPFIPPSEAEPAASPDGARSGLRLLYLGRFERRKGVQDLLRAVSSIESDQISLTLLGGDTPTAPLGTSVRAQLELISSGDPRIEFLDRVPRSELAGIIRAHDAVVLPSLWEAWPYVGLESLRLNRPLIATPVGGFTEMVRPGLSGWLTDAVGADHLAPLIERLAAEPDAVRQPRLEQAPAGLCAELTDPAKILAAYDSLLSQPGRWDAAVAPLASARPWGQDGSPLPAIEPARPPLVSVVIPYYRMHEHVEATIESVFAQTYPRIEVVIVNDGSFYDADWVLAELATRYPIAVLTQMNAGLGAARNFGISQSRGRYIVPLDPDDLIESTYVERGVAILEAQPELAYVGTWSRYVDAAGFELEPADQGYQPLNNLTELAKVMNVAGIATAVIRRQVFDLGFAYSQDLTAYEDWSLYRELGENGYEGLIIPERLFRYRIRPESMFRQIGVPNAERLKSEIDTHLTEGSIEWQKSD
jgi:glycosyltransferase involved in cell wall biosynthesis